MYQSSADFGAWFRLKDESLKILHINLSMKICVFLNFDWERVAARHRFTLTETGCSPSDPTVGFP